MKMRDLLGTYVIILIILYKSIFKNEAALAKEKVFWMVGKHGNFSWPKRDLSVHIDGDIVLGALHMVHERSEDKICGPIMPQGGIQALETMLYTLDVINNDPNILPNVKLGILAKDDCDRDIYGLEQAVDFIRGSIASIGGSEYRCRDGSDPEMNLEIIPGVIGAPSSVTSIQVANLLKLFRIPQISFFSTSTVLSSRDRYPYFLRTIPSDVNQAQAMVELVRLFNWTYVSVIYEESSYGMQGFNELEKLLKHFGICIAATEKLLKDSGVPSEEFYDRIVLSLKSKYHARGVIIFGSDQEVGELMKAVRRQNATVMFTWIGSDGWGGRGLAYEGKEPEVEGAVTVQPLAYEVRGFKDYFLSLRPDTNLRNPWFVEYWEQQFHCKYPGARWTPFNQDYKTDCTGLETIEPESFHLEAQLQFVSDALLAFAHALHNMISDICGQSGRLCPEMDPIDGEVLKNYLLHVNFTGLSDQPFSFLPNGDGPPRYRILNFRQKSRGVYSWDTVGFFNNGHLLNMSDLQFRLDEPSHPPSVCSLPCGPGEVKNFLPGTNCCWTCYKCHKYQYLPTEFECEDCPLGSLPSDDKHYCVEIPITYLRYDEGMAIGGIVFAVIGITMTAYVSIVFVRYRETPVVKASGRELSFVLLAGIFLCYTMTFALVMKPNMIACGVQKFGIGLSFSICYSAILTKTNRIARIFRSGKRTTQRPKFISPKSQLVICGVIVSVQNVIGIIWLIMRPPKAVPYFADRDDHQLVCADAVGVYYMVGFSYPILLVIVCTIYAILTRKIPEAFNESKYIGFTMYTTCIIWLAFVPIYFSTANNLQLRIATMSFSVSLSATVALICMFTPKLYIILLHPDKNIRQSIMASKNASHVTYPHTPNNVPCNYSSIAANYSHKVNEVELAHGQTPESYSSGLSKCTILSAQTNGQSISSQTLNSLDTLADNRDIAL